ncbi:MAG: hypothetical protein AB4041_16980 [Microcystaceae cyanobacterium]
MKRRFFALSILAFVLALMVAGKLTLLNSAITSQAQDKNTFHGITLPIVDPEFRNNWTPELETAFQERATFIINYFANPESYGNGYEENEKRSYPTAMFDFLAGNKEKAIQFLEEDDPQPNNHAHTNGIDYYFSFTLKGQIRKYFLFGQFLHPNYKQEMYKGAKKWTEKDPLTQPHPLHGFGDESGRDWSIKRRGRWVDSRNTDNLRAMREVAVYLMAEETGNEETRLIYKRKIHRYTSALYNIGMGEWDSPVYHSHTFAPYLNLYDFAKDPEVKQLAKAALDWMSTAAAIKYYRGGWGSPAKRDYGGSNIVFGAGAARTFWLYFGDTVIPNPRPELDTLHFITSTYRPPLAVVALAKKQFSKPLEILATKPLYENWKEGYDRIPGYWETQFFGRSYQMGSLAGAFADGDVEPFGLMAFNQERGVDYFAVNTGHKIVRPGKKRGDQIGQFQNLLLWLRTADETPFAFQFPKTATFEQDNDIWFIQLEKTAIAIFPINLSSPQQPIIKNSRWLKRYSAEQVLTATSKGNSYAGFALEVSDIDSQQTYQDFKKKVKQNNPLNLSQLQQGKVLFKGTGQNTLQLTYNQQNLLPILHKNGKLFDWSNHFNLYDSQTSDNSPINLGWKQGKLTVNVKDLSFTNILNLPKN